MQNSQSTETDPTAPETVIPPPSSEVEDEIEDELEDDPEFPAELSLATEAGQLAEQKRKKESAIDSVFLRRNRLLMEQYEDTDSKTAGGILLTSEGEKKANASKFIVLKIGAPPQYDLSDGDDQPAEDTYWDKEVERWAVVPVSVGDVVIMGLYGVVGLKIEGHDFFLGQMDDFQGYIE